jgi:SAM-dependent methyltransferase
VSPLDDILAQPFVYRLWQAPFAAAKLAPVLRYNDLRQIRRVLDVGCGPGTNARVFKDTEYVGVDINPLYTEYARRHFPGTFITGDVTSDVRLNAGQFDLVLINSLLHHLTAPAARSLLERLRLLLADHGRVHVIELVTPTRPGIAAYLARADRGAFSRSVAEWQALLAGLYAPEVQEAFALKLLGVTLWNLIYLKGRPLR